VDGAPNARRSERASSFYLLHGLLVHNRRILATGAGPAVGYGAGGHMLMAPVQAVPLKLGLPNGPASIVTWNALTVPGRVVMGDQVVVLTRARATFAIPATSTAVVLTGAVSVGGHVSIMGESMPGQAKRIGGIADTIGRQIQELTGKETRSLVLGHLQRGPWDAIVQVDGSSANLGWDYARA